MRQPDLITNRSDRAMLSGRCGVYALLSDELDYLYVGRSASLGRRLLEHATPYKHWKWIFVWLCDAADLVELEKEAIAKLEPCYNKQRK